MIATLEKMNEINIGTDFVNSLNGNTIWNIKCHEVLFRIKFECSMDDAIQHVKNLLKKEKNQFKFESFIAQRVV